MGKYVTLSIADGRFQISKEALDCTKTVCVLLIFLVISVTFYVWYEDWTIGSSITFIIVTMSTVGKGFVALPIASAFLIGFVQIQAMVTTHPVTTAQDFSPFS